MNNIKKSISFGIAGLLALGSNLLAQENDNQERLNKENIGVKSTIADKQSATQRRFLMVDGKRFFAIGSYGSPAGTEALRGDPWQVIHDNGWNCSIIKAWDANIEKAELLLLDRKLLGWDHAARDFNHKFFLITAPHFQLEAETANSDEYSTLRPELLKRRIEDIGLFPASLRKNIIGFYQLDEPENALAKGWAKNPGGMTIQEWCLKTVGWEYDLLKASFPDVPIVGVIAWPPSYSTLNVKGFCDINLPNSYPTWQREFSPSEFVITRTSPTFEGIVRDAAEAVKAAIANGQPMPIYMPYGCSEKGFSRGRQGTLAEIKYQFFAPITQGVMGIMYWASYRSDIEYAEATIFPITRALSDMTPFFTGEWLDDKIVSYSPNESSTERTKEYNIPDVSYCLRRSADGKYLLLAVNNTSDEQNVTFQFGVDCKSGREYFSGNPITVSSARIVDKITKFGVHAYILEN